MNNWTNTLIQKDYVEKREEGIYDFVWLPDDNDFAEGGLIAIPKRLIRPVRNRQKTVSISYAQTSKFPVYYKREGEIKKANVNTVLTAHDVDVMFADMHRKEFQAMHGRI